MTCDPACLMHRTHSWRFHLLFHWVPCSESWEVALREDDSYASFAVPEFKL